MSLSGIKPVQRGNTLAEDIYLNLRTAIMTGAVKPGDKVSARAVAEAAAVSFTPAREAVARLISEGALELAGPKTVVIPVLRSDALAEITKLRLTLEAMAAETAAANITRAELSDLRDIQADYEKYRTAENFTKSLTLNEAFHFTIYRASQMPRLIGFIETLWVQVGPSFNLLLTAGPIPQRPHDFHHEAIRGLETRDGARVSKAIRDDIGFGYDRLRERIAD